MTAQTSEPFTTLTSHCVVLVAENVDTDQIIPARFLKTVERRGLGAHLFADWRVDEQGRPRAEFPLNSAAAVDADVHRYLVENPTAEPKVDVARAMLVLPDGKEAAFPLDAFARRCLTEGIDELEYLRRHETAIAVWETRHG